RHESVISHKGHRGHGGMLLLPFLHVVQPGGDSLRFAQHETAVELGREFGVMSLVVHHRDTEDTEVCYCFQSWMLLNQAGIPFASLRKRAQTSLGHESGSFARGSRGDRGAVWAPAVRSGEKAVADLW